MILITLIKSVDDENVFIGLLIILASDVRLKIFADAFSIREKPLLFKRVRYSKKLAEMFRVA